MKSKIAILAAALAAAAALPVHAQTSVPTPRSVAPNYTPPAEQTPASPHSGYTYQAPHAGTWDFYVTTGAWFFDDFKMKANNVHVYDSPGHHYDRVSGKFLLNLDDTWSIGFGAGYNFTDRFSLHARFDFANPDYDGVFTAHDGRVYDIWGDADVFSGDISARFDLMTGKFRPFIQGNMGFMYVDTGIRNGRYRYYGWNYYDDYYGWDAPTVDDTYFTLGATVGANVYFSKHVFGQLAYTFNWASTNGNGMMNHRVNISVGWNY